MTAKKRVPYNPPAPTGIHAHVAVKVDLVAAAQVLDAEQLEALMAGVGKVASASHDRKGTE